MAGIVIAGAGECGVRAAFTLRDRGYDAPITLIGAEGVLPYERPPLSKGRTDDPKPIRAEAAYDDAGIDLRLDETVDAIDVDAKSVRLGSGSTLGYDKLLIATGARARLFPGMDGCLTLRTSRGCGAHRFKLRTRQARRHHRRRLHRPRTRLDGAARRGRGDRHRGGVRADGARRAGGHCPLRAEQARGRRCRDQDGRQGYCRRCEHITLDDGETLHFDSVIAGVGALPNTDLAEAAGLDVENGIVPSMGSFRTSAPDVFAAGDCCSFPWRGQRLRLESWRAAQDQGEHAAIAMLGEAGGYAKVPWFWSDQFDLSLQVAGLFDTERAVHRRDLDGGAFLLFQRDAAGTLQAAAGVGPGNAVAKHIRLAERLIEREATIEPGDLADPSVDLKRLLKAAQS